MAIYVEQVRIRNFRSLRGVTMQLAPNVTVLVGANNSGKTTFLRALGLAFNNDRQFLSQDDLFIDKDGEPLPQNKRIIIIDVKIIPAKHGESFDDWISELGVDIKPDKNGRDMFAFRTKIDFTEEQTLAQINRYVIVDWDSGNADESDAGKLTANLSGIPFHFIDAQRDLQEDLTRRTSHFGRLAAKVQYDANQRKALETALATINDDAVAKSTVLSHLRTSLEELNQTVQGRGSGVQITPFPKKVRDLHKGMKVHFQDGESDAFGLEYHGMGTRSWSALLTFKAKISWEAKEQKENNVPFHPLLGLEEPEAHLHPNAQRQVYQQLASINGQKIISTHSPHIAAQAELEELRHFQKTTDEAEIHTLDVTKLDPDEKRKVQREVLLSRGELLFAKAIILFEGETESQALPVFAEKYWGKEAFELGVTMQSVDGNNYKPFLLLAEAMQIPWFIFSDYDKKNIKDGVNNALTLIGYDSSEEHPNVIKLGKKIEEYMVKDGGYQKEIKAGINAWCFETTPPETDRRQIENGQRRVNNYSDEDILKRIGSNDGKVRYPAYWAKEITKRTDEKAIPPKIRELFDAVNNKLHPTSLTDDATSQP